MSDFNSQVTEAAISSDSGSVSDPFSSLPSEDSVLNDFSSFFGGNSDDKSNNDQTEDALKSTPVQQGPETQTPEPQANTNNVTPEDAFKRFNSSVDTAFNGENGSLNMDKINTFFNSGKLFDFTPEYKEPQTSTEDKPVELTPEQADEEYRNNLTQIGLGWASQIRDLINRGHSFDQALQVVESEYQKMIYGDLHKREIEAQKRAIREEMKDVIKPLEEQKRMIEQAKKQAVIEQNVSRFAGHFDNLIPGMKGADVIDAMIYDPKYAGEAIRINLFEAHPEIQSAKQEDRLRIAEDYINEIKSKPALLSHYVEFGRLKLLAQQLPNIIKHAQEVAGKNKQNVRETTTSGISQISGGYPAPHSGNRGISIMGASFELPDQI